MRVLELSDREEAAAFCGKLFARWGAEVIRVEALEQDIPLADERWGAVRTVGEFRLQPHNSSSQIPLSLGDERP